MRSPLVGQRRRIVLLCVRQGRAAHEYKWIEAQHTHARVIIANKRKCSLESLAVNSSSSSGNSNYLEVVRLSFGSGWKIVGRWGRIYCVWRNFLYGRVKETDCAPFFLRVELNSIEMYCLVWEHLLFFYIYIYLIAGESRDT